MPKVMPYIYGDDARKQGEFYASAFKGEIVGVQTFGSMPNAPVEIKDRIMHMEVTSQELTIYLADSTMEPVQRGNGLDLTVEFPTEEEARAAFEALTNGGEVLMPFERMFWGAMFGRVRDPFGVRWQVVTPVQE